MSRFNTNAHLARATLESIAYQSVDVAEAMEKDSGVKLEVLRVDGGVTANDLAMQIQADTLGVPVSKPVVAETTALGAAWLAGSRAGVWPGKEGFAERWRLQRRFEPAMDDAARDARYGAWKNAVQATMTV